jgi:ABC-2 type transport system permease protein
MSATPGTGLADESGRDRALRGRRRYLHIIGICWRAAVSEQLQYRADLTAKALMSAFWLLWAAVGVSVYFQFTGDIAGWTYSEILVVIGLFFAINGTRQAFLDPNLDAMRDHVRRGTLDYILLQPVNSQLLVSLRHVGMSNLADPLLGLGLVIAGCLSYNQGVGVGAIASFVLLMVASLALLYALVLVLMALTVVLVGVEDLGTVSFSVVELSRFPVQAYREPLQTLLTVVPVILLTTLPAQALLGRLAPVMLVIAPLVAATAVALASLLWRRVLRRYTGASA